MQVTARDADEGLARRRSLCAPYQEGLSLAEVKWKAPLLELRTQGYTCLREFMPRETALAIGWQFDGYCRDGVHLSSPRDITSVKDHMDWRQGDRLSPQDVRKGEDWLRARTTILQLQEPLLLFDELAKLGLNERLLDIAGAYLGALPSLGFVKARKNLVNDLPPFDTELWHVDGNSRVMVKAFLFLGDIDVGGGATEYVAGSHRTTGAVDVERRWTDDEIINKFGAERIRRQTGRAGDLVLADTTGYHRAGHATTSDRKLVIYNYVLHPEYGYEAKGRTTVKISRAVWNSLSDKQKAAADQLEVNG